MTVEEFRRRIGPPADPFQLAGIVEAAQALISGYYVHLPNKRAAFGADPQEQLRLLREEVLNHDVFDQAFFRERFHRRMLDIFATLRDLHTRYVQPEPFRSCIASLPFAIEEYLPPGAETTVYGITKFAPDAVKRIDSVRLDRAVAGGLPVAVTHLNHVPIADAVDLLAPLTGGANPAAAHALAVQALTQRWLGTFPTPLERGVLVDFEAGGRTGRFSTSWRIERPPEPVYGGPCPEAEKGLRYALDPAGEVARRHRKRVFSGSRHPFMTARRVSDDIGYIRIWSFETSRPAAFVDEFAGHLAQLPQGRLVVDIRGNPGGDVVAAQQLLQLLTGNTIEPAPMQYINTDATAALTAEPPDVWGIEKRQLAGEAFSRQNVIGDPGDYNAIGSRYPGRVALLVDASTYSAGDVFAAGFVDNEVGTLVGTAPNTGGGGAVTVRYDCLRDQVGDVLARFGGNGQAPLPAVADDVPGVAGVAFQVALQRFHRVKAHADELLEGVGVPVDPDNVLDVTQDDVMHGNANLIAETADRL